MGSGHSAEGLGRREQHERERTDTEDELEEKYDEMLEKTRRQMEEDLRQSQFQLELDLEKERRRLEENLRQSQFQLELDLEKGWRRLKENNANLPSLSEPLAESSDVKTLGNTFIPSVSISQYDSELADEKKNIEEAFEETRQQHELDNTRIGRKLFDKNDETDEEGEQLEDEFQRQLLEHTRRYEEKLKQIREKRREENHKCMLERKEIWRKLFDEKSRKNVHQKNESDFDEVLVESDHKKVQSNVRYNNPDNSKPQESLRLTEGMFEKMMLQSERKGKMKLKHSARELFLTERCLEKIRTELLEVLRNRFRIWKLENSMDNRAAVLFHFTKIESELNCFERRIVQRYLKNEGENDAGEGEKKELKTEKLWKKCYKNFDYHKKNENESIEEAKTVSENVGEILRSDEEFDNTTVQLSDWEQNSPVHQFFDKIS